MTNIAAVPYTPSNSTNPWLMNNKSQTLLKDSLGNELTAEYIWTHPDREALLEWVFAHYRARGFPYVKLTDAALQAEFARLKARSAADVLENGYIKNSNSTGLDVAKHFTSDLFFSSKGSARTKSCQEVFNDDALFHQVLKNRMGWCVSQEGGATRPYIFSMGDYQIINGMRSSGLGYAVSHFKPMISKYIYEKYKVKKVLDYSAGWAARALSALSLGVEYYGIDPLTADRINDMIRYFKGTGFCVKGCSEVIDYSVFPSVDLAFSSPPYFDLEIYSSDPTQSSQHKNYEDWLEKYWIPTVKNCYSKTKLFGFVAVEKVKKYDLLEDMLEVCKTEGGVEIERIPIKTSTNHLSGKTKTGRVDKKTENLIILEVK